MSICFRSENHRAKKKETYLAFLPLMFLFLIAYFSLAAPAHALVIKKVIITGNKKTRSEQILKWGGIKIDLEITESDLTSIIEKLRKAYQFNVKDIHFANDQLFIDIEEKWSLFPVPMLTQSGDYYSRGLVIYENNFLGRMGTFAPGIYWTNSGINGLLYYQEDNLLAPYYGLKVILLHKSDFTNFRRGGRLIDQFETRINTVIFTPNYYKGRQDHKLGPMYVSKKIYKRDGLAFQSTRLGLYYRHHYNFFKKLSILFDGIFTSYDFFLFPDGHGKIDIMHGGDIQYVKPIGVNFFKSQVHFYQSTNHGYIIPKMLGGNEGHRGYNRESLPAQTNSGFMLQAQMHIISRFFLAPFYEYNITKLIQPVINGSTLRESTVGMSASYYFEKLSIPAFILEYGRNIDDHSDHINLNVGLAL